MTASCAHWRHYNEVPRRVKMPSAAAVAAAAGMSSSRLRTCSRLEADVALRPASTWKSDRRRPPHVGVSTRA
jgi:hypothetical protein